MSAAAVGCGIKVHRDFSTVPPGQVGFDDMCGLQDYFDALEIKTTAPPRVVNGSDLEGQSGGKTIRGGRERFAFENDFLLKHLRRVLNENWRALPPEIENAKAIQIEVRWSEKAGAKRVTTDEPSELAVGDDSWALPYHVCLSELLYGEPLYRQRRVMWNLPLPGMAAKQAAPADGGVVSDGGKSEAAVAPAARDGGVVTSTTRDAGSPDRKPGS